VSSITEKAVQLLHFLHLVVYYMRPHSGYPRYIGGDRGVAELERLVSGPRSWGAVSFLMHPVSVEQVMAIADAEALMPPKATWFMPKLRSGLVVRLYDDT